MGCSPNTHIPLSQTSSSVSLCWDHCFVFRPSTSFCKKRKNNNCSSVYISIVFLITTTSIFYQFFSLWCAEVVQSSVLLHWPAAPAACSFPPSVLFSLPACLVFSKRDTNKERREVRMSWLHCYTYINSTYFSPHSHSLTYLKEKHKDLGTVKAQSQILHYEMYTRNETQASGEK